MELERDTVVKLANWILDVPYKDPDDNESVLARQYLRMRHVAQTVLLPMARGYAAEHDVGNNRKMVQDVEEFLGGTPAPTT